MKLLHLATLIAILPAFISAMPVPDGSDSDSDEEAGPAPGHPHSGSEFSGYEFRGSNPSVRPPSSNFPESVASPFSPPPAVRSSGLQSPGSGFSGYEFRGSNPSVRPPSSNFPESVAGPFSPPPPVRSSRPQSPDPVSSFGNSGFLPASPQNPPTSPQNRGPAQRSRTSDDSLLNYYRNAPLSPANSQSSSTRRESVAQLGLGVRVQAPYANRPYLPTGNNPNDSRSRRDAVLLTAASTSQAAGGRQMDGLSGTNNRPPVRTAATLPPGWQLGQPVPAGRPNNPQTNPGPSTNAGQPPANTLQQTPRANKRYGYVPKKPPRDPQV
jgi:hypothetical protein